MKKKWCVYTDNFADAIGRTYAPGDGITVSVNQIYAICASKAEAEAVRAAFLRGPLMTRARMPGDGHLYPDLLIDPFEPLDFIGRQRRLYDEPNYRMLYAELSEAATRNAATLMD